MTAYAGKKEKSVQPVIDDIAKEIGQRILDDAVISVIGPHDMAKQAIVVSMGHHRLTQEQFDEVRRRIRDQIGDDLASRLLLIFGSNIHAIQC